MRRERILDEMKGLASQASRFASEAWKRLVNRYPVCNLALRNTALQ